MISVLIYCLLDIAESHSECISFLGQKGNFSHNEFSYIKQSIIISYKLKKLQFNFKLVAMLLYQSIVLFSTIVHQMQKCCFQEETLWHKFLGIIQSFVLMQNAIFSHLKTIFPSSISELWQLKLFMHPLAKQ